MKLTRRPDAVLYLIVRPLSPNGSARSRRRFLRTFTAGVVVSLQGLAAVVAVSHLEVEWSLCSCGTFRKLSARKLWMRFSRNSTTLPVNFQADEAFECALN